MATKVKELTPATLGGASCRPDKGGCCSRHRRVDRIYEDQVWRFALKNPGISPWK